MIAQVEQDVRGRLGNVIFGADDDTLPSVTMAAARRHRWTLACVELGLSEGMQHSLPNLVSLTSLEPGTLAAELQRTMNAASANAGLGIACFPADMAAELAVITPFGDRSVRLTYGGHPRNLPRWAFNSGLNLLRLEAQSRD
jgi:hypothetical protein